MKANDFAIQSMVKMHGRNGQKGMIIGNSFPDNEHMVAVEWEDGKLEKVDVSDLDQFNTDLERDFLVIKDKISHAAESFKEAIALADKHGKTLRDLSYDYDLDIGSFRNLFNDIGWSSSNCW